MVKVGAGLTLIELEPVRAVAAVSVAVIVCVPAVSRVADKLGEVPSTSVEFAGKCAVLSVLENCTVPWYPRETLPAASSALTTRLNVVRVLMVLGTFKKTR